MNSRVDTFVVSCGEKRVHDVTLEVLVGTIRGKKLQAFNDGEAQ